MNPIIVRLSFASHVRDSHLHPDAGGAMPSCRQPSYCTSIGQHPLGRERLHLPTTKINIGGDQQLAGSWYRRLLSVQSGEYRASLNIILYSYE